jgi:hypothetical protein
LPHTPIFAPIRTSLSTGGFSRVYRPCVALLSEFRVAKPTNRPTAKDLCSKPLSGEPGKCHRITPSTSCNEADSQKWQSLFLARSPNLSHATAKAWPVGHSEGCDLCLAGMVLIQPESHPRSSKHPSKLPGNAEEGQQGWATGQLAATVGNRSEAATPQTPAASSLRYGDEKSFQASSRNKTGCRTSPPFRADAP